MKLLKLSKKLLNGLLLYLLEVIAMSVENLEDFKEVWVHGWILCVDCSHKWVGICHVDRQSKLQCPECGGMKGVLLPEFEKED